MVCFTGLSRLRELYKNEVKYATDDFVYETGKGMQRFKAATKKQERPKLL